MSTEPKPAYQVVARRFRPRTFAEVVGQDAVVRSLQSALESGRIPHALLFSGSRGVGKTTSARILARALNCERGPAIEPCNACPTCEAILADRHPDVVEIDAASHNLVDDIRDLRERVGFASMGARYKVYILDEVHMLTRNAFNAFLKTLEEPPARVVFVLATTELHKVPDTIRSRCQVLLFRRVGEDDVVTRLETICAQEGVALGPEVLQEIALGARGGMRDAETALERVLPVARAAGDGFDLDTYRRLVHRVGFDRAVEVVEHLLAGRAAPALQFADEVVQSGVDEREALGEITDVLRSVLLLKVDGDDSGLVAARGALRERMQSLAASAALERLDAAIQAALVGRERIRRVDDRRLVLELTLLRIAQAGQLPLLGDLVAQLAAGTIAMAPPTAGAARVAGAAAPAGSPAGGGIRGPLLVAVRRVKPMLASTVEACEVVGPDAADRVVMRLANPSRMHRDRLKSPDVQKLIRDALQEVCGRPVSLEIEADGASAPTSGGAGRPPPRRRLAPAGGPVPPEVEKVRKRFDGTLIDPQQADG